MNITAALYRAAHGYAPGMPALAEYLGISAHSLAHKVSPNYPSAHCSPDELVRICEVTGDLGALQAQAQALGQVLMPLPASGAAGGDDLARKLAASCKEFGDFVSEISADLSDGKVTPNELARIEREAGELIGAVHVLLAHAAALAAAGRPGGVAQVAQAARARSTPGWRPTQPEPDFAARPADYVRAV